MRFTGRLACRRSEGGSHITLDGRGSAGERVIVSVLGVVPADLPSTLESASVEPLGEGRYRIAASGREWVVEAARQILHVDASAAFYAALPPYAVPFGKRVLWRLALAAAATRLGRRWLQRGALP